MYSENFDLSKYHAKIDIKEKNHAADSTTSDVFYSYNSSQNLPEHRRIRYLNSRHVQKTTTRCTRSILKI